MRNEEDRPVDLRRLRRRGIIFSAMHLVAIFAVIFGTPVLTTFFIGDWAVVIVYVIAWVAVGLFCWRRSRAIAGEYQWHIDQTVDFERIIGQYIDLTWFDRDRTFLRAELSSLMPDGGYGHANEKVRGNNMMAGKWKGLALRSAFVEYGEEGYGESYDPEFALFKGQLTIIDAPTGFHGKLLAIRPVGALGPKGGLTKQGVKHLLSHTGLGGRKLGTDPVPGWEVYADGNARALFDERPDLVDGLLHASGMHFMLIEEDHVAFLGDYQFRTDDYSVEPKAVGEDCEQAMWRLVDEGLRAAGAACGVK